MIVTPLTPQKPRAVALLRPGYRNVTIATSEGTRNVTGATRCYEALAKLSGHQCYVEGNLHRLVHTTGAQAWTADVWRGRATTMYLYGTALKVSSLRRTLDSKDLNDSYESLARVLERLSHQGVRAGSVSSMAWNLWRSTLRGPIDLSFDPEVGRSALFGGRQESPETGRFAGEFVAVDLKKAYPFSMAEHPYATSLRRVSPDTTLDAHTPGFVTASVIVPDDRDHPFPPLPTRLASSLIQWRYGEVEGTWTWGEVVAARDLGCTISVSKCWAPRDEVDLFGKWFEIASRATDPLEKAINNNLWGNFALSGTDRATVTWRDQLGEEIEYVRAPKKKLPHARLVHIAAETTSRVRVRMLNEGLYGDKESPVHVDTDGIVCSAASAARRVKGTNPGEWRDKTFMHRLEVKGPQLYRYHCGDCGISHPEWHYVAAGIPKAECADFFENKHPGYPISFAGLDQVAPSSKREVTPEQRRLLAMAATRVRRAAFGEELA